MSVFRESRLARSFASARFALARLNASRATVLGSTSPRSARLILRTIDMNFSLKLNYKLFGASEAGPTYWDHLLTGKLIDVLLKVRRVFVRRCDHPREEVGEILSCDHSRSPQLLKGF